MNPSVAGYKEVSTFKDIPLAGDPDAAKKILTDAKIKTPYKIELRYPQSDTADKQAAALKETWDKAGFDVKLSPEGDVYYSNIQKPDHNYDVGWAGWGADWPSPMTVLPPLFDSRANITSGSLGQDYGKYVARSSTRRSPRPRTPPRSTTRSPRSRRRTRSSPTTWSTCRSRSRSSTG